LTDHELVTIPPSPELWVGASSPELWVGASSPELWVGASSAEEGEVFFSGKFSEFYSARACT